MAIQYRSLLDAGEATEDLRYGTGRTQIWYTTPESFRALSLGPDFARKRGIAVPSDPQDLLDTHVRLGVVDETRLESIFVMMQGEVWSPHGEANSLIRSRGLRHTSMSVGDVVVLPSGKMFMVDMHGFTALSDAGMGMTASLQGPSKKASNEIVALLKKVMHSFGLVLMPGSGALKSGPHRYKTSLVWTAKAPWVSENKKRKFNFQIYTVLGDGRQVETVFLPDPTRDRFVQSTNGGTTLVKPLPGSEFGLSDVTAIRKTIDVLVQRATREVEVTLEAYDLDMLNRTLTRERDFGDSASSYALDGMDDDDLFVW